MNVALHGISTCLNLKHAPTSHCPVLSHCPMGWTGLSMCLTLGYTLKSQCPVLSHSPVRWMGLSIGHWGLGVYLRVEHVKIPKGYLETV